MNRPVLITIVMLLLTIFAFPLFSINHSQTIVPANPKIVYELPFPGILPDHPFYFMKAARDRVQELGTRDNIKKAELYLSLSDKRLQMATALIEKGKEKLAISTLSKGEKYFLKITPILLESKKQGVGASQEFIDKLKNSNKKHKEVIEALMKHVSEDEIIGLTEILKYNNEIAVELNELK